MKKKWHHFIVYVSLLFLAVALYRAEYLRIPIIYAPLQFLASLPILCGGFVMSAFAQQRFLAQFGYPVGGAQALAMTGLNIFGKYIPGKVWMVVGSAVYLHERNDYPLTELSLLFLQAQLITLWSGLLLGIGGLLWHRALYLVSWIGVVAFIFFTALIFWTKLHDAAMTWMGRLLKKNLDLPSMSIEKVFQSIPWFLGMWLLWGGGFFLLADSISARAVPFSALFCFPLAGTIGILFLLAPGGLGVREGVIVAYLTLLGTALPEAVSVSAASRVWFLVGEIFLFFVGYLSHRRQGAGRRSRRA